MIFNILCFKKMKEILCYYVKNIFLHAFLTLKKREEVILGKTNLNKN